MSNVSALSVSRERTTYQQHLVNFFIQSKACEKYLLVSALGERRGAHIDEQFLKEQSGQAKEQDKTEKSLSDMRYTGVPFMTLYTRTQVSTTAVM